MDARDGVFPCELTCNGMTYKGINYRDFLAMNFMSAFLSNSNINDTVTYAEIAKEAYTAADALIKEGNRGEEN